MICTCVSTHLCTFVYLYTCDAHCVTIHVYTGVCLSAYVSVHPYNCLCLCVCPPVYTDSHPSLPSTDPPYCAGADGVGGAAGVGGVAAATHVVVAANASVSLRCRMEAVPNADTFTWRVGPPLPPRGLDGDLAAPPLQQTPAAGGAELPTQDTPEGAAAWEGPWREAWRQLEAGEDVSTVQGRRDPQYPDASTLTLRPGASTVVGCFARNRVGHTRVPCRYTLTVVGTCAAP